MSTLIVGCGYLGRRIGRKLDESGENVFGTVRSEARADRLKGGGIEPILADVTIPDSLDRLPAARRVVYCVGFDRKAGVGMREVYVDGLQRILDRLTAGVERFIYASSTGVFGQDDGHWVDEDAPTEPRHESGRVC